MTGVQTCALPILLGLGIIAFFLVRKRYRTKLLRNVEIIGNNNAIINRAYRLTHPRRKSVFYVQSRAEASDRAGRPANSVPLPGFQRLGRDNKGTSGIDEITIEDAYVYIKENWERIRAEITERKYKPQPVKRVEIPKANGGTRNLGIPTVMDSIASERFSAFLPFMNFSYLFINLVTFLFCFM